MTKLYIIIPLLCSLLFSHYDSVAYSRGESLPVSSSTQAASTLTSVNSVCTQPAKSLNPHVYKGCQPRHALSPENINKISGFRSRFKAHLKRAAVTPGHPLHDLIHSPLTLVPAKRVNLADAGIRKTFQKALLGEIETGIKNGLLDTAELGLKEATAAEITGLAAVAPELAVPVLGMALSDDIMSMVYKVYNYMTGGPQGVPVQDPQAFISYLNSNHRLKIKQTTYLKGKEIKQVDVLIPLHCQFPIVPNKLYLGNYDSEELKNDSTIQLLRTKLGNKLYAKALKNIQPILDDDQYCNYLEPADTVPPFKPIRDIENKTRRQNKLFLVIRPMIVTKAADGEITVQFLQDKLFSRGAQYTPKYLTPTSYLSVSIGNNPERFAYRGTAGQFDDVSVSARLGDGQNPANLFTFTSITFYNANNGYIFPDTVVNGNVVDISMALQRENVLHDNGVHDINQLVIGKHISVYDILDWSTYTGSTKFDDTLGRVKKSMSFMSIAPKNTANPDTSWLFRGKERSSEAMASICRPDTAEALARILDFLDINTNTPGVMGQIEFMTAIAANSINFEEGALINNGLLRYGTNGYGVLRFNRVFDVFLAYQQSLDRDLVRVDIKGESNGNMTTKSFPNNLRLFSRSIPLEQLSETPNLLITNFSHSSDGSGEGVWYQMLSEPMGTAIREADFPLRSKDIELKLTSNNAVLQNVTLEFVIDISLHSEGEIQKLAQQKVSCNDSAQCNSRPSFSRHDDGPETYTTKIGIDSKIIISITTWKNLNQIQVPLNSIFTSLELKYLKERSKVISM